MNSGGFQFGETPETDDTGDGDGNGDRLHVLVVEDERKFLELFESWLYTYHGDDVAVHSEQSLAASRETLQSLTTLDVAILDRKLPDGTGDELLEPLKRRFDAITVMITAVRPESDVIEQPIDDYIVKPADEETFLKRLSLLEKLDAAQALDAYADARKASLLEYHLDDPAEDPLFRRLTAKWEYDRLEIAHYGGEPLVYELYAGDTDTPVTEEDEAIQVSVTGTLSTDLRSLLADGAVRPAGEIILDADDPAWVARDADGIIDTGPDAVGIYEFTCDAPERYVTDYDAAESTVSPIQLSRLLERGFS